MPNSSWKRKKMPVWDATHNQILYRNYNSRSDCFIYVERIKTEKQNTQSVCVYRVRDFLSFTANYIVCLCYAQISSYHRVYTA